MGSRAELEKAANRERCRDARERLKATVLAHYGTSCACCGITDWLCIDHLDGNGHEHRLELFGRVDHGGEHFYRWLIREGFPEGYQTLCRGCNASKKRGPHCRLHDPERLSSRKHTGWAERAACAGLATRGNDPWHPGDAESPTIQYAIARRICAQCPVQAECLRDGLELLKAGQVRGMWGGLTPDELRSLARRAA